MLSLAPDLLALAAACAPTVAPTTMLAIIQTESAGDPLAINVNGSPQVRVTATSRSEASRKAGELVAAGRSVDLGLAQINSRNLAWLGLTVEQAFDDCLNLSAAGRILTDGYQRAGLGQTAPQTALRAALSYYNTGHPSRGLTNGYVDRVLRAGLAAPPAVESSVRVEERSQRALPAPWDVFGDFQAARFVNIPEPEVHP
ncbi:MAG: lytic transglycosylase domain-containing protein [Caulobacterales bacterium]|nr:lytic transglycosylase domain-containing protein [Caulobacterales bacterium]